MRLIDADYVIKEAIKEQRYYQMSDNKSADFIISGIRKVMRIIEEAPTIQKDEKI